MQTNIYSMFKLPDNSHITYEFNPGKCTLPIAEHSRARAIAIGFYEDSNVGCYIYEVILLDGTIITHQPNGTLLHSTYYTDNATSPVESGIRATAKGYNKFRGHNRAEEVTAEYFKSKRKEIA